MNNNFRVDIQILRGVAVLLVFAAHAGVAPFSGGYVGVDVFFVISGYVITQLLLKEYEASGNILLSRFYARRLQRLLPALMLMLVSCSLLSILLFVPSEQLFQQPAAVAAAFWVSNFHFLLTDFDYFAPQAGDSLYLHTWSLGVEEQFYLLWPLFLLIGILGLVRLKRSPQYLGSYLLLILLLSLLLQAWLNAAAPLYAFYLMPARAWQFALGGFLAWRHVCCSRQWLPAGTAVTNALALAGLGLIALAAVWFDADSPYPGWRVMLPSVGAGLLLAVDTRQSSSLLSRVPLLAPLRWVGDVSYSFYLWHWPVLIIFDRLAPVISWLNVPLALALTLLLSTASYYLLENPVRRNPRISHHCSAIIAVSLTVMLVFFAGSLPWRGFIERELEAANMRRWVAVQSDGSEIHGSECDTWYSSAQVQPCVIGPADAQRRAVLIGDSVLTQWYPAVLPYFTQRGWQLTVLTKSACPIVNRPYYYSRINSVYHVCDQWRTAAVTVIQEMKPDLVIMGSAPHYPYSEEQWKSGTRDIIESLSDSVPEIKLIAGTPKLQFNGPNCLARMDWLSRSFGRPALEACTGPLVMEPHWQWLAEAVSEFPQVQFVEASALVCPGQTCSAMQGDVIVFRDHQHLSREFVQSISADLVKILFGGQVPLHAPQERGR